MQTMSWLQTCVACFVIVILAQPTGAWAVTLDTFEDSRVSGVGEAVDHSPVLIAKRPVGKRAMQKNVQQKNPPENTAIQEWPYSFSKDQEKQLRMAGYQYSDTERQATFRMKLRGFSAEEFVAVYLERHRMGLYDDKSLSVLASMMYLNVPTVEYSDIWYWGYSSFTEYYNYTRIGGKGLKSGGWVLFSFGTALLITCGVLSGKGISKKAVTGTGISGGILVGAGLPMGIAGSIMTSRWAPATLLDTGTVKQLQPYRQYSASLDPAEPPETRLVLQQVKQPPIVNLTPQVSVEDKQGGLGLLVQF